MSNSWQPKPGDRVFRPHRVKRFHLKRILGVPALFALTYAEGTAMLPEAGGSFSFARHAFNDTVGFVAGWALMLSYIVTMAISAYTIPPYLSHFWPVLKEPVVGTAVSIGIILFLMLINVFGIRESSRLNIYFIVIDIATQLTLVVLGIVLILCVNPGVLFQNMFGAGNWPSTENLIFGIAIAALCFTGVETVSRSICRYFNSSPLSHDASGAG